MINNRIEFNIVCDIYSTGVDFDSLSGEQFNISDLIEEGILIKNEICITSYDEIREHYDIDINHIHPSWTVIKRGGYDKKSITVAHSYEYVKAIYKQLQKETDEQNNRYIASRMGINEL